MFSVMGNRIIFMGINGRTGTIINSVIGETHNEEDVIIQLRSQYFALGNIWELYLTKFYKITVIL